MWLYTKEGCSFFANVEVSETCICLYWPEDWPMMPVSACVKISGKMTLCLHGNTFLVSSSSVARFRYHWIHRELHFVNYGLSFQKVDRAGYDLLHDCQAATVRASLNLSVRARSSIFHVQSVAWSCFAPFVLNRRTLRTFWSDLFDDIRDDLQVMNISQNIF